MSEKLPTRLGAEPLVEVIAELRFDAADASALNLLPGLLSQQFPQFDEIVTLPIATLPLPFIGSQDELRHLPHVHLRHENNVIAVGPRVISVAQTAPYSGWTSFSTHAIKVFEQLKGRKFIKGIERISLRYADLISFDESPTLDWLNAEIKVGAVESKGSVQLRVEHDVGAIRAITQVISPASLADGRSGLLVDVDCVNLSIDSSGFWENIRSQFDQLHSVNKDHFFSLLTQETRVRLKPEYE